MAFAQLVYLSRASWPFSREEVETLIEGARPRNQALGITGLLLYGRGFFLQLLEGDAIHVGALFMKIGADTRHSDVLPVVMHYVPERLFPGWEMGLLTTDGDGGRSRRLDDYIDAFVRRHAVNLDHTGFTLKLLRDFAGDFSSAQPRRGVA
jgi:hypothetical protein